MSEFGKKTVLVTGSARGIGKAIALQFADCGANVIVNYRHSQDEATELCARITNKGVDCMAIQCDISEEDAVEKMIDLIEKRFGKIDYLVNNAGSVSDKPILQKTGNEWLHTLGNNLVSQHLVIKYAQRIMPPGSRVVNVSSTSALYATDSNIADYDAAKAGVIVLTKNYAKALAPNISVNCVIPGWIKTSINDSLDSQFIEQEVKQSYLKRFGEPEEVAKVVLFLCSKDASFINGTSLIVDGGHN